MQNFLEYLKLREQFLKELIAEKKKSLKKAPNGVLNIARSGNRVQYYYKEKSSDKKKMYIKKNKMSLVKKLCQKDYDKKVLMLAEKELSQILRLSNTYMNERCETVYEKLSIDRQELVLPIISSDEEFIECWEQEEYEKKGFWDDSKYFTDRGERVRSKTEILIANALAKYDVPYKYEKSLYLDKYGNIHPDFTVLNVRKRKELYWEHMGMMDDPHYVEKALERIDAYQKNGIYPGDRLILTHETAAHPMNSKTIDQLIKRYLIS